MEIKNRTLSNFAELVRTGECKKFRGRLKVGVDLGTANTVLAVVDVGGGTTGISILKDGKVIYTDDEATGGSHMTMTVAGHYKIPYEEAEVLKTTPEKEDEIFPVVKATIEKMATITEKFLNGYQVPAVYVVGGSASFREFTNIFEKKLKLPVYRPVHPLLVTPLGIAYNCELPPVTPKKK